jgi:iron complex transport system substrate-binding protein
MLDRHCERSEAIQIVRRLPLDCRVALLLAMTISGCTSQPQIPPAGIVSNNPCIDAILAEVAAPGQIAAVSAYSQNPESASAPLAWSRALPALGTSAEEIIAAKPTLVLTGNFSAGGTNAALAKAGVQTLGFGVPATVEESVAQVRSVAGAIGRAEVGERLVARIEGAIVTPSPLKDRGLGEGESGSAHLDVGLTRRPLSPTLSPKGERESRSAIIWQTGGFVAGKGTLQDDLLSRAGYRNASATYGLQQWDILPLETLIRMPPNVIFMPLSAKGEDTRALAARQMLLRHLRGKTRIVNFPDKLLFCGGPTIVDVMRVMRTRAPFSSQQGNRLRSEVLPFKGRWPLKGGGGVSRSQEKVRNLSSVLLAVTPLRHARARHLPSKGRILVSETQLALLIASGGRV